MTMSIIDVFSQDKVKYYFHYAKRLKSHSSYYPEKQCFKANDREATKDKICIFSRVNLMYVFICIFAVYDIIHIFVITHTIYFLSPCLCATSYFPVKSVRVSSPDPTEHSTGF